MKKCICCKKTLAASNSEIFCFACQNDPNATHPMYVVVDPSGNVYLEFSDEVLVGVESKITPVHVSVQDYIAVSDALDALVEAHDEGARHIEGAALTFIVPKIIAKALR